MRHRSRLIYGVPATLMLLTALWNEKWSWWAASTSWPRLPSDDVGDVRSRDCAGILLVADPQLIGYRHEPGLYGPIARWDADRYLATGFAMVKWKVGPDAIVFLGDLFDEGVDASDDEWNDVADRFQQIFPIDENQDVVYIAGDNDIGGEAEPISQHAKAQFARIFRNNVSRLSRHFEITESFLFDGRNRNTVAKSAGTPLAKILLTHLPYLANFYAYSDVGHSMDLILSAHDHTAAVYELQRKPPTALVTTRLSPASAVFTKVVGVDEALLELQTPTCSYRMGVPQMGYGTLSVCKKADGQVQVEFAVLWLPSRYPQLYIYLAVTLVTLLWILFQKRRFRKRYHWLQ